MNRRRVHWLPTPANEGTVTACGRDINDDPEIQFRTSQNEVDCKRCLAAHVAEIGGAS